MGSDSRVQGLEFYRGTSPIRKRLVGCRVSGVGFRVQVLGFMVED